MYRKIFRFFLSQGFRHHVMQRTQDRYPTRDRFTAANKFIPVVKTEPWDETEGMIQKRFNCTICERRFTTKMELIKHCEQHKMPQYSPYVENGRYNISGNIGIHTVGPYDPTYSEYEDPSPTFACMFCNKVFKTRPNLTNHLSKHTGLYMYTCSTCNKGFNTQGPYMRHLAEHAWNAKAQRRRWMRKRNVGGEVLAFAIT